jgi:DNA-directed RNA polymerase specialized sigma24 family protein
MNRAEQREEDLMLKVERKQAYATRADFCQVFKDEMKSLYLLAFLLTANHARAEECFLAALADADKESVVFKEFAASWVRRLIVAHAIRLAGRMSSREAPNSERWVEAQGDSAYVINRLAELRPLDRFVFVLTMLERYREVECAILLGRARAEVTQARTRALEELATVMRRGNAPGRPPLNHRDQRAAPLLPQPPSGVRASAHELRVKLAMT